jgi:3-dehydroquinate dehydratase/shikimate dehydrogenase
LSFQTLLETYNFRSLNEDTKIYGLLGDPVAQSKGHKFHNKQMHQLGKNAVYVKWQINSLELPSAVPFLKALNISGLSITMPLKESILHFIDKYEKDSQKIGAINSIVSENGSWIGFNTDGRGALDSLESYSSVHDKTLVIFGAGGSAKAIAHEAHLRGAKIIIFNRNREKAKALADEVCGRPYLLSEYEPILQQGYDFIVNTLPHTATFELKPNCFVPGAVAFDISYGAKDTPFTLLARQAGCVCVDGHTMFTNQAKLQLKRWFGAIFI